MNKLNVALIGFAFVACLVASQCGGAVAAGEDALTNEIEDGDLEVNEDLDGLGWGRNKDKAPEKDAPYWSESVAEQWGDDIIQKGIQKTVKGRHQACGNAKSEANCRACCAELSKAYSYKVDIAWRTVKQLKSSRCVCVSTTPQITPV